MTKKKHPDNSPEYNKSHMSSVLHNDDILSDYQ